MNYKKVQFLSSGKDFESLLFPTFYSFITIGIPNYNAITYSPIFFLNFKISSNNYLMWTIQSEIS